MRTRRSARLSSQSAVAALLEIEEETETDAETTSEPDIPTPSPKRVKTSPKPRRNSRSVKKKGPLTQRVNSTVNHTYAIAASLQSPAGHDACTP